MTVKQRFIIVKVLLGGFNNQKAMFGASSGHSACMFKGLFSIMSKYIFNGENTRRRFQQGEGAFFRHRETSRRFVDSSIEYRPP